MEAAAVVERTKAKCPTHPNCTRALLYDFDCGRVICLECRPADADVHRDHKIEPTDIALRDSEATLNCVRDFISRVDSRIQKVNAASIKEKEWADREEQAILDAGDEWVVSTVVRLLQQMQRLRRLARVHQKPEMRKEDGPAGWSAEAAKLQRKLLKDLTDRARVDENASLVGQRDARTQKEQLTEWMNAAQRRTTNPNPKPLNAAATFREALQKCAAPLQTLEADFAKAVDGIQYWTEPTPPLNQLRETRLIEQKSLVAADEKEELYICGIVEAEASDSFYIADMYHAKVKHLNITTATQHSVRTSDHRALSEVTCGQLIYWYFAIPLE